jgi:hypothetical protein
MSEKIYKAGPFRIRRDRPLVGLPDSSKRLLEKYRRIIEEPHPTQKVEDVDAEIPKPNRPRFKHLIPRTRSLGISRNDSEDE